MSGRRCGTTTPFTPSEITEGTRPTAVAIGATPQAIASSTAIPKPSKRTREDEELAVGQEVDELGARVARDDRDVSSGVGGERPQHLLLGRARCRRSGDRTASPRARAALRPRRPLRCPCRSTSCRRSTGAPARPGGDSRMTGSRSRKTVLMPCGTTMIRAGSTRSTLVAYVRSSPSGEAPRPRTAGTGQPPEVASRRSRAGISSSARAACPRLRDDTPARKVLEAVAPRHERGVPPPGRPSVCQTWASPVVTSRTSNRPAFRRRKAASFHG